MMEDRLLNSQTLKSLLKKDPSYLKNGAARKEDEMLLTKIISQELGNTKTSSSLASTMAKKTKRKKLQQKKREKKFFLSTHMLQAVHKMMVNNNVFEYAIRAGLPRDDVFYLEQQFPGIKRITDNVSYDFYMNLQENSCNTIEYINDILMIYRELDPVPMLSGDLKKQILASEHTSVDIEKLTNWLRAQFLIKQIVIQVGQMHGVLWSLEHVKNMNANLSDYELPRPNSNPEFNASTLSGGSFLFSQSSKLPPLKLTEKKRRKLGFDESFTRATPRVLHYNTHGMRNILEQQSVVSSSSSHASLHPLNQIDLLRKELQIAQSGVNELNKMVDDNIAWVQSNCEINKKFESLSYRALVKCKTMALKKIIAILDFAMKRFLKKVFSIWKLSIHYSSLEVFAKKYCRLKSIALFRKIIVTNYTKKLYSRLNKWLKEIRFQMLTERIAAIVQIQRIIRGFLSRRKYTKKRLGAAAERVTSLFLLIKAKHAAIEKRAKRTADWAARIIQNYFKGIYKVKMAKKELAKRKGNRAAVRIQALFRGQKTREEVVDLKRAEEEEAARKAREAEEGPSIPTGSDLEAVVLNATQTRSKSPPKPKKKPLKRPTFPSKKKEPEPPKKTEPPAKKAPAKKKPVAAAAAKKPAEPTPSSESQPAEPAESTEQAPLAVSPEHPLRLVPPLLSPVPPSAGVEIGIQVTFREDEALDLPDNPLSGRRTHSASRQSRYDFSPSKTATHDMSTSPMPGSRPHTPGTPHGPTPRQDKPTPRRVLTPTRLDVHSHSPDGSVGSKESKEAKGHHGHHAGPAAHGKKEQRSARVTEHPQRNKKGAGTAADHRKQSAPAAAAAPVVAESQAVKIQKLARGRLARMKTKKTEPKDEEEKTAKQETETQPAPQEPAQPPAEEVPAPQPVEEEPQEQQPPAEEEEEPVVQLVLPERVTSRGRPPSEQGPLEGTEVALEEAKEEEAEAPAALAIETVAPQAEEPQQPPSTSNQVEVSPAPSPVKKRQSSFIQLLASPFKSFRGSFLGSRPSTGDQPTTPKQEDSARAKTAPSLTSRIAAKPAPEQLPEKIQEESELASASVDRPTSAGPAHRQASWVNDEKTLAEQLEEQQQQREPANEGEEKEEREQVPRMDLNKAGLHIQLVIRRIVAIKRMNRRKREVLLAQQQAAEYINWSAQSIQKVVRGKLGRKRFDRLAAAAKEKAEKDRQDGAVQIQCLFRKLHANTRVSKLKKLRDDERKRVEFIKSYQKKKTEARPQHVSHEEEREEEEVLAEKKEEKSAAFKRTATPPSNRPPSSSGSSKNNKSSPAAPPANRPPSAGHPYPHHLPQQPPEQPETRKLTEADLKLHELEMKLKQLEEMEKRIKQSEENVILEAQKAEEKLKAQMEMLEEKAKQHEAERLAREELMKLAVGPLSHRTPFSSIPPGGVHPAMMSRGGPMMMSTNGGKPPGSAGSSAMNTQSRQLMLYPPHELATLPKVTVHGQEWVQLYDENYHAPYWWCEALGQSQWHQPTEDDGASEFDVKSESGYESVGGLTDYSDHESSYYSESEAGDHGIAGGGPIWQEYWDEQAQAKYWYNNVTGEASWTKPEGVGEGHNELVKSAGTPRTGQGWTSYIDEQTGQLYWHNIHTGEVQWDY